MMKVTRRALLSILELVFIFGLTNCYRISKIYQPFEYHVSLNFPKKTMTTSHENAFSGFVQIYFRMSEKTPLLQLHMDHEHLKIISLQLNGVETSYQIDNETNVVTVTGPQALTAEYTHSIDIKYEGILGTTVLLGAYKSSYLDSAGKTHYIASTMAAPLSTRMMFPCFDEPAFKAVFKINITAPNQFNAISNAAIANVQRVGNEEILYSFEPTPLMSPYLVAFVVSEFTCTPRAINTVTYGTCSRKEALSTRQWALDIGPKILETLNNYTNIDYGKLLNKLDTTAVGDFAFDAIENWGVPIFSESTLLWDPDRSSNYYKKFITRKLAHQFSHQWFGNLVTCDWWSDTYLNEAFASYLEYEIVHQVIPQWQMQSQFNVDTLQTALLSDGSSLITALQSSVTTTTDILNKIGQCFSKGGSVFRMLHHIMGKKQFQAGIQAYLKLYAYENVFSEDLWAALEPFTDNTKSRLPSSLDNVMKNWVEAPGFPIVTATLKNGTVSLTQERYMLTGSNDSQWYVPISYTLSTDQSKFQSTLPQYWLVPDTQLKINISRRVKWIILNNQQAGYFRANYDQGLWNSIGRALSSQNFSGIHELNRAQIVDDIFNLARINKTDYSNVFNTIDFIKRDTSYFTWVPAFNGFNFLLNRVGQESALGKTITKYILSMMNRVLASVPFAKVDDTDMVYTLKQVLVQKWACKLGEKLCTEKSGVLFGTYRSKGIRPPKNFIPIVFCTALSKSTNRSDWDMVWNDYLKSDVASEKADLLTALSCSTQQDILKEFLKKTIADDEIIRPQDRSKVFSSIVESSPVGFEVAFEFLLENYKDIALHYQDSTSLTGSINSIAKKINKEHDFDKLTDLIQNKIPENYRAGATASIEEASVNIGWNKIHLPGIQDIEQLKINNR